MRTAQVSADTVRVTLEFSDRVLGTQGELVEVAREIRADRARGRRERRDNCHQRGILRGCEGVRFWPTVFRSLYLMVRAASLHFLLV